jgi:DNA-binding FrmR family transcriptional regulator
MLHGDGKKKTQLRLRRIAGQVQAIERMIESDRYCVDVLHQVVAVEAALRQVGKLVLRAHVDSCVAEALTDGDARARKRKVEELVDVFTRYGAPGRP